MKGRSDTNKTVVFDNEDDYKVGEFVKVRITDGGAKTLVGKALGRSTIQLFAQESDSRPFLA